MADQLSARDWLDQGLKVLAKSGFTALKAEPLAKALAVSRGSFYWHFRDVEALHAAILQHWRDVAAEAIIAELEMPSQENPLGFLLRRAFAGNLALERAVRVWATVDPAARKAVHAIDRRRLGYVKNMLKSAGHPPRLARARAQILYWAFVGYALSDKPLSPGRQAAVLEELIGLASRR